MTIDQRITYEIIRQLGAGMVLRVPFKGSPSLIENVRARFPLAYPGGPREAIPVSADDAAAAISSGRLFKLTKDGNPPPAERKKHDGYRLGWQEIKLDGTSADLYVLLQ
jgi:hypothetical protein